MNIAPVEDPILGQLTPDESLSSYEGAVSVSERQIPFNIEVDPETGAENSLIVAREIVPTIDKWLTDAAAFAAAKLLELKNESWLEEDEVALDEAAFIRSLTLSRLIFYPDRSFSVWFDDGEIFYGHLIMVEVDAERQMTDAYIAG